MTERRKDRDRDRKTALTDRHIRIVPTSDDAEPRYIQAPYSSYLASVSHDSLPVFLFSAFAFAAAASALFLPEVHGEALPDTLEDLERLVDGTRMWSMTGKKNESRRRRRTSTMRKSEGE